MGLDARVLLAGAQLEVERFYAAADVLALPTRYEPFGNVCLEALAMGLPVITTRVNGVAELLEGEAAGLTLEDPLDPDPLVAGLLRLLDPVRRKRIGAWGRERAGQRSTAQNGREIREILTRVARERA